MPSQSPELIAVSRRWYKMITARGDRELKSFLSKSSHLRFAGTSDGEMWLGPAVREAIDAHFDEVPVIIKKEELAGEAFEEGSVGWSFFNHRFWFETVEEPIEFRTTLIFALEVNCWKIIHRHASIPRSNLSVFGNEHTAIKELMEAAQKGFSLGQREGLASIMFTDIVGSSILVETLGDQRWSGIIADHFHSLRKNIEQCGGQFVKSLSDGTMSSFSSARQALQAAQLIQAELAQDDAEPNIGVRIGLHTGDVVQSDEDFFGTVVNKAARITSMAGSGEVYVSDATCVLVGDQNGINFSKSMRVSLSGFEGEHLVHRLKIQK